MKLQDFVRHLIGEAIDDIHTALPARVEKFDPVTLRGEVIPLAKWRTKKDGGPEPMPVILDVPFWMPKAGPFVLRMPVQRGDTVLLVFAERALDYILADGKPQDPKLTRCHALDDAIALPGLLHQGEDPLLGEHDEDVILWHREKKVKWVLKADGTVLIENLSMKSKWEMKPDGMTHLETPPHVVKLIPDGAAVIESPMILLGSEEAAEGVPLGTQLKTWLDGHTHSASGAGPPSAPSPDPSKKVKLE